MKEQAFGQGITMLLQLGSPAELEKLEMTDHSTGKTFLENCSAQCCDVNLAMFLCLSEYKGGYSHTTTTLQA
jgi:hypothetical protein